MFIAAVKVLVYMLISCGLLGAGLMASFTLEREHGQMGMAYYGLFYLFCISVLPLNAVIGIVTEVVWKRENKVQLIIPVLLAFIACYLFLNFGMLSGLYFTSDRDKAPLLIGRSLEFLNPKPDTRFSNVNTYYPIMVMITFFLPFAVWPLFKRSGLNESGCPKA